jgi:hypothetical protein
LRKLLILEPDIPVQRRLQFFARSEMVALQHLLDPAVNRVLKNSPLDAVLGT